jgi:hypothetical protein
MAKPVNLGQGAFLQVEVLPIRMERGMSRWTVGMVHTARKARDLKRFELSVVLLKEGQRGVARGYPATG